MLWPLYPGKDTVAIVQEAGWAPGPVWTGAANLAPTRVQSPDRPARSEPLYRLNYPGSPYSGCKYVNAIIYQRLPLVQADPNGCAVEGVSLRPLACWGCGFESHLRHGWLSVVYVVCYQVEVCVTS
jgi:hypothetical protein